MPGSSALAYRELIAAFPPRPIHGERDLRQVEQRIEALLTKPHLSPAEQDYLDLLSTMVHAWEREHEMIPRVSGLEVIKYLMAERGLRNRDLTPIFRTESIVSEVLSRKRSLQAAHIQKLADYFNVSPEVFFPLPDVTARVNHRESARSGTATSRHRRPSAHKRGGSATAPLKRVHT